MMEFFKGTVTARDWVFVGVILAVTVLLAGGFYFLVHQRQLHRLEQVLAEDRQVQEDLRLARTTQENIDGLREEAAKMQELVDQFQERLPEKREIPTLLRLFEGFAREIGLRVELSMLDRTTDADKETYRYSVTARGDFHEIVSFINRLERYKRYLKVSDLDIGEQEAGVSEASFKLSTYLFLSPEEEAAE